MACLKTFGRDGLENELIILSLAPDNTNWKLSNSFTDLKRRGHDTMTSWVWQWICLKTQMMTEVVIIGNSRTQTREKIHLRGDIWYRAWCQVVHQLEFLSSWKSLSVDISLTVVNDIPTAGQLIAYNKCPIRNNGRCRLKSVLVYCYKFSILLSLFEEIFLQVSFFFDHVFHYSQYHNAHLLLRANDCTMMANRVCNCRP